jgi:hypothetical protein
LQISDSFSVLVPADILAGVLDPFCGANDPGLWFCDFNDLIKSAFGTTALPTGPGGLEIIGFPAALQEIWQTDATQPNSTAYSEDLPTPLQSLYFVRWEDSNGNLSQPSNIVGAPSFLAVTSQ